MDKLKFTIVFAIFILFLACASNTQLKEEQLSSIDYSATEICKEDITQQDLEEYISYLASDELEGRLSGSEGNIKAGEYIAKKFNEYGLTAPFEDGDSYFQHFELKTKRLEKIETFNVVGYLPGNHPELKNQYIVIGAHFDHVGYGEYGSRKGKGSIHNGADDNASGTGAVMELAEAFSLIKDNINRTIIFIAFSGEELGLHGSKYYCKYPIFPHKDTIFMLNLDMIGWLKDKGEITAYQVESDGIEFIMNYLLDDYPFTIDYKITTRGNSDHFPFSMKNVPVAFFHTGLHDVYHTPDDDVELLDFVGMELITEYSFEIVYTIDMLTNYRPIALLY